MSKRAGSAKASAEVGRWRLVALIGDCGGKRGKCGAHGGERVVVDREAAEAQT